MQRITALLPMKGHSERVPNKNIRDFAGMPLLFHVLDSLVACSMIETVLVNTDSAKISQFAQSRAKVRVIERPAELCGGDVPMNDIIAHDLQFVSTEHVLQTHSTNPLLTLKSMEKGILTYFNSLSRHDSLFSVTKLQARFYWPNGLPVNHNPLELLRTQDLHPLFEENSCMYVFSHESFRKAGNRRIGLKPLMYPLNVLEAIDIDEEEDFIQAEILALKRKEERA
ncbi:MAG: acylneuraminate cytidylyltransferase family protein [Desulfovibrio sp.]|jgi:CMP-N-acetylneuraminic acid synthetase|nr:acylneuraminate cytidylyltransferase family protein [Desulfovibrio sp.]